MSTVSTIHLLPSAAQSPPPAPGLKDVPDIGAMRTIAAQAAGNARPSAAQVAGLRHRRPLYHGCAARLHFE
jgi:hypothetical protein